MSAFEKLIRHFEHFPGIGSRQARRFVFHLLTLDPFELDEIAELIRTIRINVVPCPSCARFHTNNSLEKLCAVCDSSTRDRSKLLIVEHDSDIDAIERSGVYDGLYFVLGGTVPLLESHENKKLRGGMLKQLMDGRSKQGLKEIILGFSVNPDGENTGRYIEMLLKDYIESSKLKISHLGRGLSTGSELEYADPETIRNALKNRS